jgi:hypothetical protein
MGGRQDRVWKEVAMTYFKVGYYPCIRLESLRETKKTTCPSDQADSGLHLPSTSPKYSIWAELETVGPLEEDFVLATKCFINTSSILSPVTRGRPHDALHQLYSCGPELFLP